MYVRKPGKLSAFNFRLLIHLMRQMLKTMGLKWFAAHNKHTRNMVGGSLIEWSRGISIVDQRLGKISNINTYIHNQTTGSVMGIDRTQNKLNTKRFCKLKSFILIQIYFASRKGKDVRVCAVNVCVTFFGVCVCARAVRIV